MKYELNIVDRIVMAQILNGIGGPGSYLYQKELRKLREAVSFTEKQWKEYGMETLSDSGAIRWDPVKAQAATVEVEIGDRVKNEVAEALKKLDKAEQLQPEHMNTYDMFVPPEEPPKEEPKADANV